MGAAQLTRIITSYAKECRHFNNLPVNIITNLSKTDGSIGRINTPVIFPIYNKKQAISNRQVIINPLAAQ
jgi:hypothetical protein